MQRTFAMADQRDFAALSGDHNPLHVDPLAARRLLFGSCVAHGVHVLLWGLDVLLAGATGTVEAPGPAGTPGAADFTDLIALKADFRNPVPVDAVAEIVDVRRDGNGLAFKVVARGQTALTASATLAPRSEEIPVARGADFGERCDDPDRASLASLAGTTPLALDADLCARLLPGLTRTLPGARIAALLAATRIVGMRCPGLHSIFKGLDLTFSGPDADAEPVLAFRTAEYDERVSRLDVAVQGPGVRGALAAFVRPAPTAQSSAAEVAGEVAGGEFSGQRALILGGSRGLGEVTAKLLAAGGAEVCVSFHRGEQDAQRLVRELATVGPAARCIRFDILAEPARMAADLAEALGAWRPTHLYVYATPPIAAAPKKVFDHEQFDIFCRYYVQGFHNAALAALEHSPTLAHIFYPSTVFLDELPLTMGAYIAAKAAGESLCAFLAKAHKKTAFHAPRLPRLATDQTASVLAVDNKNPVPYLLTALREMNVKA